MYPTLQQLMCVCSQLYREEFSRAQLVLIFSSYLQVTLKVYITVLDFLPSSIKTCSKNSSIIKLLSEVLQTQLGLLAIVSRAIKVFKFDAEIKFKSKLQLQIVGLANKASCYSYYCSILSYMLQGCFLFAGKCVFEFNCFTFWMDALVMLL